MILRDPIHGLVSFEGRAERVVEALLSTREVQRLRRVRQLGLASLVFPGAEHSRFAHAVGAAHVMSRLTERLRACDGDLPIDARLDDEAADDAVAAALLHDLGHGPFSHLFEDVLPHARHHEEWTAEAVLDPGTDVHRALERLSGGMSDRVAALLTGKHRLRYLARAISGPLDVDRADYLLRDSHMTGVRYGLYDLDWLLRALAFGRVGTEWVLAIEGRKGLPPIESFFLARHFMYQQVYHHKAIRAAEALVRSVFSRLTERIRDGQRPGPVPRPLEAAALGEPLSLGEYLELDDAGLLSAMADWERGSDPELSRLCGALRNRVLPKTIPLAEDGEPTWGEAARRAREVVAA
ncbi:MAG: HD domain-containing protein, partial [Polyangiaceae bacterium]|nr:HD domain-containing protein [Polyangiaceae bacterium]